jgi:ABC-2 type transport system ATP-binding protein
MIKTVGLTKTFKTHKKLPGFLNSVKSLFAREWVEKIALHPFDLEVKEGEIIGLVGANGAGKTTLVKMLAGIMHPSGGDANVLGFRPWERDNNYLKQMALIMGQKAQLWWDLPAADSFELLREIYSIEKIQFKKNLSFLVETLGVQDQLHIQVRRLSLGERMKMELIAALLHQPKVIYLDEPTIGLDLTAQMSIRKFIKNYRQEFKPAIILTSHYMEDIEYLCERIVIVKEGKKVYDGSLSNVVKKHVNEKIVTFTLDNSNQASQEIDINKTDSILDLNSLSLLNTEGVKIIENKFPIVKIRAQKKLIPKIVQEFMSQNSIRDIDFSEEDISVVIESLIRSER